MPRLSLNASSRFAVTLALLSSCVPTALAQAPAKPSAASQQIVVTGRSVKDTEAALKACIERKCPPDQDVAASLAHAENLLVNGDYDRSRSTLRASINRNRKHGDAYPEPVSGLYRANSRVAEHMGEAKSFQLSVLSMRDVLRSGLGPDDFRTLVAQVEVGDSRAKLGFPDEALRIYKDIEGRALKLGQNRVATFARLRQALLYASQVKADPQDRIAREEASKRFDQIATAPLPGGEEFVIAAEVMRAKLDTDNPDATAALVRRFAERGGASRPLLLFSEPIPRIDLSTGWSEGQAPASSLSRLAALDYRDQWADVGFWIGQDGVVTDVEVLRSSGSKGWIRPVLTNISKRIYAPLRKDSDAAPGFYMIERYTLTARFETDNTGTHIRRREPTPRIERLDITPENHAAPMAQDSK